MTSLNTVWLLICGTLVFFMQAGFAMLETGFTRAKKPIHLPPKEEGVFLEILDKFVFKSHLKMNDQLVLVLKL